MFRRNNQNDTLPSTTYGTGRGSSSSGFPFGGGGSHDGSGRSIKMDAPVVKAWRKASVYTRVSYCLLGLALFLIFYGFRSLRYWNASIWLTCHQQDCTLEITPPGKRTLTVVFPRTQLHSAQPIKTDADGKFDSIDKDKYEPPERKKSGKKYKNSKPKWNSKGPDEQGRYRTYRINILKQSPEDSPKDRLEDADFSSVNDYVTITEGDMYGLHFRQFGMAHSRMRVRSNINKVESYARKRRQKLLLKESANLPWQGVLCLVSGLVGLLLIILIGQFFEEEPRRQIGPGARRSQQKYRSTNSGTRVASRPTSSSRGYRKISKQDR